MPGFPRTVTNQAKKLLNNAEILLFIGARQAGKTTILKQLEEIIQTENLGQGFYATLEDPDVLGQLNASPKNIFRLFPIDLKAKTFLFLDEIQYLSDPSHCLKYLYDAYAGKIKLLVSGSSAFYIDKKFTDSMAGRKRIFPVRTLSFSEFLCFKNESGLATALSQPLALLDNDAVERYYREYVIYGGYPRVVLAPGNEKAAMLQEIAYSYIKKDILEARVKKDELFFKLFKLLAAQTGQLVNASELSTTLSVSKTAIDHYLYVMQKSCHVRLVKPWFNNARKTLTKMPKIYFYDTGLRNFFTGSFDSLDIRPDRGALLENAVFRQLLECESEENINFWRTTDQHEVDFVVNAKQAYEVKMNSAEFKSKKYARFREEFPSIPLALISLNAKTEAADVAIKKPWELHA